MFSGFQEILLIGLIIVGILVLPRMMKSPTRPVKRVPGQPVPKLSGTFRLAIVLSLLWPICWAAYFEPWQPQRRLIFAMIGIGPVIIAWSVKWILAGMTNR